MLEGRDIEAATRAVAGLQVPPRPRRWGHLSLNLLEAVFSPGASAAATAAVVRRYAQAAGLRRVLVTGDLVPVPGEQDLQQFIDHLGALGPERFSREVLGSSSRTSTRGGILRAQAALELAQILRQNRVTTMAAARDTTTYPVRVGVISRQLALVKGHGTGTRISHLWRLLGDDDYVHVDEPVHAWCARTIGRPLHGSDVRALVPALAGSVGRTPWEVDHAIWHAARVPHHRPAAVEVINLSTRARAAS